MLYDREIYQREKLLSDLKSFYLSNTYKHLKTQISISWNISYIEKQKLKNFGKQSINVLIAIYPTGKSTKIILVILQTSIHCQDKPSRSFLR